MKKISLFLFFLLGQVYLADAQFMNDALGRPIKENKYTAIDGSPFLIDNWTKGDVKTDKGVINKDIDLKYDMVDDRVTFRNPGGQEMDFVHLITSFTLYTQEGNRHFKRFSEISEYNGLPFFEVMGEGEKLILLKKTTRAIMENKAYGSATTTRSFSDNTRYFLLKKDGTYEKVKKDKKAIMTALADKTSEMEAFVKENKTDFKKESDLSKLMTYYNSL